MTGGDSSQGSRDIRFMQRVGSKEESRGNLPVPLPGHLSKKQMAGVNTVLSNSYGFNEFQKSGAPGQTRTGDPLLRSQLSTLIRTCRSDRKARENQQLVMNGDKLLTPFSSPLSRGFAAICHNYYYAFL